MQPPGIFPQPTYARVPTQMKHRSSWLSLIGSCVLMAVGAAVAFAIIVAAGSAALADRQNPDSEPQAQQQALAVRLVVVDEVRARMQDHPVVQELDVARPEVHIQAVNVAGAQRVDQRHRFELGGREPRHLLEPLRAVDVRAAMLREQPAARLREARLDVIRRPPGRLPLSSRP